MDTTMAQAHRIVTRCLLALVVVTAPLVMAGWFAACPQYGDPACPSSAAPLAVINAFRNANSQVQQLFMLLNLIAPYIYPLSYLILGMLAINKSPWLATLGMVCGWCGGIAWGFIADTMLHISVFAQSGADQTFIVHENGFFATPYVLAIATGWVLGHMLGYVFIGIALFRARVIPRWASILLILSAPVMGPLAYGSKLGMVQIAGYLMVLIASIPAAITISKANYRVLENRAEPL